MPKPRNQGFNKEKIIFSLSLAILAGSVYWYWSTSPDELQAGIPLSATEKPGTVNEIQTSPLEPLENILAKDRMSPFTPKHYMTDAPRATLVKVLPPPAEPPPQIRKPKPKALDASDKELEVSYMGIIKAGDQSYALIKSKDGTSTFRVKEGDTMTVGESKYTVAKIDSQAVQLTDADGQPWTLKDGLFDPANSISANPGSGSTKETSPGNGKTTPGGPQSLSKVPAGLQGLIPPGSMPPNGMGGGGKHKGGKPGGMKGGGGG